MPYGDFDVTLDGQNDPVIGVAGQGDVCGTGIRVA
jgi:hypothetical protein